MRHPPSGRHPYLTVRLRGSLTLRYRRCDLESRQQTISHKEELNLNFVPSIRTTNTGYDRLFYNFSFFFGGFYNFSFFIWFLKFFVFYLVFEIICTSVCWALSVSWWAAHYAITNSGMVLPK